jgi:hypothetical protein
MPSQPNWTSAIERAFAIDPLSAIRPLDRNTWEFVLQNGREIRGSARARDGWLLLDAPLPDLELEERDAGTISRERAWDLLQRNARLAGGVKYALPPTAPTPRLRTEFPLDGAIDLDNRIRAACAGFKAAVEKSCDGDGAGELTSANDASEVPGAGAPLAVLIQEAGWPCTERSSGRLAVDLDVPGAFHQAIVEERSDGLSAAVDLVTVDPSQSPDCCHAVGVMHLELSSIICMARPAAAATNVGSEARLKAGVEVVFASRPTPRELDHGLAALSIACRLAAAETTVLHQDERTARAYLALRGRQPARSETP